MLEMGSVRLVSKFRNCFPFFENPLTSVSELTNILSLGPPSEPPAASHSHTFSHRGKDLLSLRQEILAPGSVLNTICRETQLQLEF